jgi:Mn2+/Fe2+ NRAMP family transporter
MLTPLYITSIWLVIFVAATLFRSQRAVESAIGEGEAVIKKKRLSWKRQNERRRIFLRIVFSRICLSGNVIQLCIISSLAIHHKTE